MKIEVTEYKREDGVYISKIRTGNWLIGLVSGPTWFWSVEDNQWIISHVLSGKDLDDLAMPKNEAMSLLKTVKKKHPYYHDKLLEE